MVIQHEANPSAISGSRPTPRVLLVSYCMNRQYLLVCSTAACPYNFFLHSQYCNHRTGGAFDYSRVLQSPVITVKVRTRLQDSVTAIILRVVYNFVN